MIEVRDLTVRFGGKTVFEHSTFTLPETGVVLLRGASGIGKTTLLRVLSGLLKPETGSVSGLSGRKVSFAFQEPRLLDWMSALENVALVSDPKTAESLLTRLGLENELREKAGVLSGGQKQRVSLARAFAFSNDVVLLDEPFSGLDEENKRRAAELIRTAKLALVVTHDAEDGALLRPEANIIL